MTDDDSKVKFYSKGTKIGEIGFYGESFLLALKNGLHHIFGEIHLQMDISMVIIHVINKTCMNYF